MPVGFDSSGMVNSVGSIVVILGYGFTGYSRLVVCAYHTPLLSFCLIIMVLRKYVVNGLNTEMFHHATLVG